jgi:hypothetical protein
MKPASALLRVSFLLLCWPALAQSPAAVRPDDFAWQWPLDTAGAEGVVRVTLTPEVYGRITRADLGDLVAFNGANEPIPFGPATLAFERLQPPPPAMPVEVPLFRVPRSDAAGGEERIALHIARGEDGRLTRLDAEVAPASADAPQDVLLDVSTLDRPVTALQLTLAPGSEGLNARIAVAASDDLSNWQPLADGLALVSLREGALVLERTRLEIPATDRPYLRLRRTDAAAALPLDAVRAVPARGAGRALAVLPAHESAVLQGRAVPSEAGVFEYRSAGPFPLERIAIALADANSVSGYVLESRADDGGAWLERARGTAFRLGSNGDGVTPAPLDIALVRDTHWRLRTDPAQARPPSLALSWRPEQFVLLTQGAGPYRLAAGSRGARRPDYPLRTVLSEMRAREGDLWLPPQAALGAGAPLAGDTALAAPPPPLPYKQWLLWGVLVLGAALVVGMVLKLMRAPSPEGATDES